MLSRTAEQLLARGLAAPGPILVLTGAGISAESGIPTFRGPEGYWVIGARHYQPMELATHAAFRDMPDDVWGWYLYRRAVCRAAQPNAAHTALVALERALPEDRFVLVTQNVDGLHLRAGHDAARVHQVHGNIDFMRCEKECTRALSPVPSALDTFAKGRAVGEAERALLCCPSCGGLARPHVLWFDEIYEEEWYRFDSSLAAAEQAALMIVVGTSGATNLPTQMCLTVANRGTPWIVVDPESTSFGELAKSSGGTELRGTACDVVPQLTRALVAG